MARETSEPGAGRCARDSPVHRMEPASDRLLEGQRDAFPAGHSRHKDNYLAYDNLGTALTARGKLDDAIFEYHEALRIKPDFAEAHNNLGSCLLKQGQLADAINQFAQALKLNPGFAEAHFNLAVALGDAGRAQDAIVQYQATIRLKPDFTDARYNLANALSGIAGKA